MVKHAILVKEIRDIKNKPVKERTDKEHLKLVKAFGGVRNYLLSMGKFKYLPIKGFEHKCICYWSKNNKYGFIPCGACSVHGKQAKKTIKKYKDVKRQ